MNHQDLRDDIGRSLCRVCEAALQQGMDATTERAQEALHIAKSEIGPLESAQRCPMDDLGIDNCPLINRPKKRV